MKHLIYASTFCVLIASCNAPNQRNNPLRKIISLNGEWHITKTDLDSKLPVDFNSKAPVPGLVDLSFSSNGEQDSVYEDAIYWYKTSFTVNHEGFEIVRLKINKAKYHTEVYINDQFVGDNYYSFTPSIFDVKPFLASNSTENTLLISVGCKNNLPDTVIKGNDYEKIKYIPGIYDDVSLIVANAPYIENIQIAPNIQNGNVRIIAEVETKNYQQDVNANYAIRELISQKVVAKGQLNKPVTPKKNKIDFTASIPEVVLWSPENPFLYELELSTSGDLAKVRFGMRSFSFDVQRGCAMLNGKPYYMRGTNVCIFRFFEDDKRQLLPWDKEWPVRLHEEFKNMHWNSIRYCIGFPPERWYDIADSLGFLIQDEYPIWTGSAGNFELQNPGMHASQLAAEYKEWMKERWNHASVVIWDAQNESINDTTGKAILQVRQLDLSNRPWDNGWAAPVGNQDCIESHPYLFNGDYGHNIHDRSDGGILKRLLSEVIIPHNGPSERTPKSDGTKYGNPIIINEYAWLWINRDGTPTTLTEDIYTNLFPEAKTNDERRKVYARHLGILTEYWRCHRKAAAVMHFCGLGYSRNEPLGYTSDNFVDLKNLVFEPSFYEYVKPSFSPLGLMIEMWDREITQSRTVTIPVHIINDTYELWSDTLTLSVVGNGTQVTESSKRSTVEGSGKSIEHVELTFPAKPGKYSLIAEINYNNEGIRSIREFEVK